MTENRLIAFLTPVLAWILGGMLLLAILAGVAHADTGAAPAMPDLGFEGRLAAWCVAVYTIARTVLEVLKVVAPRTPAKWDDEVRDALARILAGAPPAPPENPPGPLPTIAGKIGLLAILAIGAGLVLQPGCAAAKRDAVVAKDAVVQCTKADAGPLLALVGELAADVVGTALHAGGVDWDALVSRAKEHGVSVGGCAFAAIYKALEDREPASAVRSLVAQPDAARAALDRLRAALGGPRWQLADGSVL